MSSKENIFLWYPVFIAIGIIIYFSLNNEPGILTGVIILLGNIFILFFCKQKLLRTTFLLLLFSSLGFVSAELRTALIPSHMLKKEIYLRDISATVKEIVHREKYIQLVLTNISNAPKSLCNVRIAVRTKHYDNIHIGDVITTSAKLLPPPIMLLPYSYDFAQLSFFNNISAVGFATSRVSLIKRSSANSYFTALREDIYSRLSKNISSPYSNIIAALVIGKRTSIKREILQDIRNSGLAHLLAISGLHLTMVSIMFFALACNVLALWEKLTLKYNIRKIAAIWSICASLLYLLLAGSPISAQRAFTMVCILLLAIVFDRSNDVMHTLSIAAILILLSQPEAVLKPSFQMSFIAVLALCASYKFAYSKTRGLLRYPLSIMVCSFIASSATAVYTIYNFNYFSISGIVANVIAIPVTTFFILPLSILIVFCLYINFVDIRILNFFIQKGIDILLSTAKHCASFKYAAITVKAFPTTSILLITLGILLLCLISSKIKFSGIVFILLGLIDASLYHTPDLLVNSTKVAIKGTDDKLYFLTSHHRDYRAMLWLKQNAQSQILKNNYLTDLLCSRNHCIYRYKNKRILFIKRGISDCVKYNCAQYNVTINFAALPRYLVYKKKVILLNGQNSYFIWLDKDKILDVNTLRGKRKWAQ